jgi:lipopolysaccharide export system permease protein
MSTLGRYVVGQYLRVFGATLFAATAVFLIVDLVDRIGEYSEYSPTAAALATFYAYRLPRILTDVYPGVALLAVLLSLGLLARNREILALRACGVGSQQLAVPLLGASALVSFAALVWSETVVPPAATEARHVRDVVIKKKKDFGVMDARSIWFQDRDGFVNIDYFDATHRKLHGLRIYVAGQGFQLQRIVDVPVATWRDDAWHVGGGTVKEFDASGRFEPRPLRPGEVRLTDPPSDLAKRRPNPEEFTLGALRERVAALEARGLDASEARVDMHAKLALPLAAVVSVLVGFPLAVRGGRRFGLAYNVSVGLVTGFAYWVTMAVSISAGRAGAVPPLIAAWSPNLIFAAAGVLLHAWSERAG